MCAWIEGTVGLEFENNGPPSPVVEHEIHNTHVHVLLSRRFGNRGAGAGSFTPRRTVESKEIKVKPTERIERIAWEGKGKKKKERKRTKK